MNRIILVFFLLILGSLNAYAQSSIPEEFYLESQLYDNNLSNNELAISIDKFSYSPEEQIKIFGYVNNYKSGIRVFIEISDNSGNMLTKLSISPGNSGDFELLFNIPKDYESGKLIFKANYGGNSEDVIVEATLEGAVEETLITIPHGSNLQSSEVNFNPKNATAEDNSSIIWTNKDKTIHTVVSGKFGLNNKIYADGMFDSGIIGPDKTFELSLKEGNYQYFCRLHPWLVGSITVIPSMTPYVESTDEKQEAVEHVLLNDAEDNHIWSTVSCDGCLSNVTLSSDNKKGLASIHLSMRGSEYANGTNTTFGFNFEPMNLNAFDSMMFWIKMKGNSEHDSQILLLDSEEKSRVLLQFNSFSFPTWTELTFSLTNFLQEDQGFDLGSVKGFYVKSPEGSLMKKKQMDILLDDIRWTRQIISATEPLEEFVTIKTDKNDYIVTETVLLTGQIKNRESDSPVTIQIFNPIQNLVTVNQIVPDPENKTFSFAMQTLGNQLDKEGLYKIVAQYGVKKFKTEISFTLLLPHLVEQNYKAYDIYVAGEKFYAVPIPYLEGIFDAKRLVSNGYSIILTGNSMDDVKRNIDNNPLGPFHQEAGYNGFNIFMYAGLFYGIPENDGTFDILRFENGNYSQIFTANWIDNVKILIDNSLVPPPPPPFPVSDDMLLVMWNERKDLQLSYPEVRNGNFNNLTIWAKTQGWNEDPRLAVLIPEGQTPSYLQPKSEEIPTPPESEGGMMLILQFIVVMGIAAVGGVYVYKYAKFNKKTP